MSFFRKASSLSGGACLLFSVLFPVIAACTAATTVNTATCDLNIAVVCIQGTGYSCQPGASLAGSPNCSAGIAEANGDTAYCCTTGSTGTCVVSSTVTCMSGAAYDCTGTASPATASLTCSAGVAQSDGTVGFCCASASATAVCNADSAIDCSSGGTGYDCTGGIAPDPSKLTCGMGETQPDGSMGFCCSPATMTPSTCTADASVSCVTTGSAGYSCAGTDTPYETTSTLICETAGTTGGTSYCCLTSANSCVQAPAITDCPSGAIGVSCTGTDMPAASGASNALICNPDPGGAPGGFCCGTN
jgi:hypothetical protein